MNAIRLGEEKQVFRKVITELINAPLDDSVINCIVRNVKRELMDVFIEECEDYENFLVQFDMSGNLSPCEIYEITKQQCQRADGQYIFKGVFTPREVCEKHIEDRVRVLTMTVTKAGK